MSEKVTTMNHRPSATTTQETYADLEIRILELQNESYPVEITLNDEQEFPRGYLGAEGLPWVPSISPIKDGERLFEWLFADAALKTAWAEARGRWPLRRIRLRIDAAAPELHAIPWELLRDAETGPIPQDLAAAATTPFSRYLAGTWQPGRPIQDRPIKILVAISNPEGLADYDLAPLDVEVEWSAIQEATADPNIEAVLLPPPCTLSALEAELRQGYHILHFVGHGSYSGWDEPAALFLADQQNQVEIVDEVDFAAMLARQLAQRDDKLRLVFLASCQTATRSPADAFRGFAPALIAAGVPAVMAMQDRVPITTARNFARTFYQQLLQHGLVDLAGNEARSTLLTGDFPGSSIPVLFSRLIDNQLVDVSHIASLPAIIPRQPFEPETVFIPAGSFLMGRQPGEGVPDNETPQHAVTLPDYEIGKYPVTNEQYEKFVEQNPERRPRRARWRFTRPPRTRLDHPVVGVSWYDALAYCEWLSQQTGRKYRLPTEAEWEKAARGNQDGRTYPWGDELTSHHCNYNGAETTAVDQYERGQSPYGCYDMAGNAREWTTTLWGEDWKKAQFTYPYQNDERDNLDAPSTVYRICRGGSYNDDPSQLGCSARSYYAPNARDKNLGFRVVLEV